MMKALKGVFIYLLILFGLLLMVSLFLVSTMFAFRYKIFGYGVIGHFSNKEVICEHTPNLKTKELELTINASHFDVIVKKADKFRVSFLDRSMGLVKGEMNAYIDGYEYKEEVTTNENNKQVVTKNTHSPLYYHNDTLIAYEEGDAFEAQVKDRANKMVINLVEPEGYVWYKDCTLSISLPADIRYTIILNGKTGNINLDTDLSYAKLQLTTTSGGLSFNKKADTMTFEQLVMRTTTGRYDFSNITKVIVSRANEIGMLEITDSVDGKFSFAELSSALNINTRGVTFTAKRVVTGTKGFYFDCKKGKLTIEYLDSLTNVGEVSVDQRTYMNSISAETAGVTLGEVRGDLFIATTTGDVKIAKVYGDSVNEVAVGVASITTTNGDISIDAIRENCILSSTHGDIHVNYYKGIKAYSRFGNLTVKNCSNLNNAEINYLCTSGLGYKRESLKYNTILKTSDGNIDAKNILSPCDIMAENKGNVNVEFLPLYVQNIDGNGITNASENKYNIVSSKGNIHVTFNWTREEESQISFVLEFSAKRNKVSGNIGSKPVSEFLDGSAQVMPTLDQLEGKDTNLHGPRMYVVAGSGNIVCETKYN